ncbi:MAG TPA: MobF family relaxase [Opitutaceae bacterium]
MNLQNAREYFREHLCVGDYYSEGQQVEGEWIGVAAEKLGLRGRVGEREFLLFCEGLNPETGGKLTQRLNTVRFEDGKETANRRIFHDFTISPPKSVSIVALYQDARIVDVHERAVRTAMKELEQMAETRVRKAKQNVSRVTGNIVAASFGHETSREMDPHLHTHCVVFNATFDPAEGRWKALQTEGTYRAQKFAENLYYHEVAKGLRALGYGIENNARDFEIKGVPADLIARFSKRHDQIEAEAQRRVALGYKGDIGELRTRIAHGHRRPKQQHSTADELRTTWRAEMSRQERRALENLCVGSESQKVAPDVQAMVAWADEHVFERRAVVNDYELMSAALARGRGDNFDLEDLKRAVAERNYVREDGSRKLTCRELLGCELDIILAVRDGRNCHAEFNRDYEPDAKLSSEQARAARRILTSQDFVTVFRGVAGAGKSHTLKAVERGLTEARHPVGVLTPQRQQAHDLESDGLPAQTLAQALTAKQLPERATVILDEAGQVGGRDLRNLIGLVRSRNGRLILSGDTRQHGAVASDALRAIEKHAYPRVAVLRSIRRQDPDLARSIEERRFIRQYRRAVKEAAGGKIADSFDRLEKMGCIRELPDEPRRQAIAGEYLTAIARGERPLVVAQTWSEVHAANEAVRASLVESGRLAAGATVTTYQPVDRDEARRRDQRFYEHGQCAMFVKGYGRFKKGELCEIDGSDEHGVRLVKDGRCSTVSYRYAGRFTVAKAVEMEISPGDRLQVKANGRSAEGERVRNGELVTVARVDETGALVVTDERGMMKTLNHSQRLLVRGYAVTSYSSQGKTADTVIVSESGVRAATSAQQWYVGISRGRKRVVVLTPDKDRLRQNIQRTGERDLAVDVHRADMAQVMRVPGRMRRVAEGIDLSQARRIVEQQRQRQGERTGIRI